MSVNRYLPHVFVLPEDDANRQLAVGFLLGLSTAQAQVLTEAGGWTHVRDDFASDHVIEMRKYTERFMVLLIDFDNAPDRLESVKSIIPEDLRNRVFVLGAKTEPEALKRAGLGTYERIGQAMANDCHNGTDVIWEHDLLRHNREELARLRQTVYNFLFH
jgi:hypothetical protein